MTAVPTVAVVGAGPAGIAASRWLRDRGGVRVVLITSGGTSDYLPGTLTVATGDLPAERYRVQVDLDGVEVVPGTADAIEPGVVRVEGSNVHADALIAAPGLGLDLEAGTASGNGQSTDRDERALGIPEVSFWDPPGAEAAAPRVLSVERGILDVVITSLPYRCPPAPYGLAMRIAVRARRLGLPVLVRLFTPEPHPLAALGRALGDRLLDSCATTGVEVHTSSGSGNGEGNGDWTHKQPTLRVVVPRHRTNRLLADLALEGSPLVPVDAHFATEMPGVFVAGDAAKSPYPRAAGPAEWSGVVAATSALAALGIDGPGDPGSPSARDQPVADCLVDHGGGAYGRIQVTYPNGPPPAGVPAVTVADLALAGGASFEAAHEEWRAQCSDTSTTTHRGRART